MEKIKEVIFIKKNGKKRANAKKCKGRPKACSNSPGGTACLKQLKNGARNKKLSSICRYCAAPTVSKQIKKTFLR